MGDATRAARGRYLAEVPQSDSCRIPICSTQLHIIMCGISCIINLDRGQGHDAACLGDTKTLAKQLDDSLELIKHRGPDSRGQWISPDNKVGTLSLQLSHKLPRKRRTRKRPLTLYSFRTR